MAPSGLDLLKQELEATSPPLSLEIVEEQPLEPEMEMGSAPDVGLPETQQPEVQRALASLYGPTFPLLKPDPDEQDWVTWAKELWNRHEPGVRSRLHLIQRNRLFRKGVQWIASQGALGPWKEPAKPKDAARVVYNMVGPALDQRVQVVAEQRPGFRVEPATRDPSDMKKAEATQLLIEYQYKQQQMAASIREAEYWAGTDGVAFWELYWDPEKGPWHQPTEVAGPQGPQAAGPDGQPLPPGASQQKFKLGDVGHRLLRIENVRVSADATATRKPWYWVTKELISKALAIREYGLEVGQDMVESGTADDPSRSTIPAFAQLKSGYLLPQEDELLRDQETVARITVYCEPSDYLGRGLHLVVVGDKVVVGPMGLLCGVVPMVRFSDGSSDPSFFCTPTMDTWLDSQQRINAVLSKWVENIRVNAGPKLLAKLNSIVGETLIGSTTSVISVKGLEGLDQLIRPLDGMSLAPDAEKLLLLEKKAFEDVSGWNDTSRGSFTADQSGRAILAIRETLERINTPMVNAAAEALTEWAKITVAITRWGYDIPRNIGVEGSSRMDLALALSSDDLDGAVDIWVDPETMIPMPRALRLFLLDDALQKGLIGAAEYRRRIPFAFVGNFDSPDDDQLARAKRCAEALRRGQWLPILWQDDEAVHQDVLQRELILPDDMDMQIRQTAMMRWQQLGMQMQMKMGAMAPMGSTGAGQPQQGAKPQGQSNSPLAMSAGMSPSQQPLLSQNPSVAAGGAAAQTAQGSAASFADQTSQR